MALAVGALVLGGAIAIGRLTVGIARIKRLVVKELNVGSRQNWETAHDTSITGGNTAKQSGARSLGKGWRPMI